MSPLSTSEQIDHLGEIAKITESLTAHYTEWAQGSPKVAETIAAANSPESATSALRVVQAFFAEAEKRFQDVDSHLREAESAYQSLPEPMRVATSAKWERMIASDQAARAGHAKLVAVCNSAIGNLLRQGAVSEAPPTPAQLFIVMNV